LGNKFFISTLAFCTLVITHAHAQEPTGETNAWRTGKGLDQYARERLNSFVNGPSRALPSKSQPNRTYATDLQAWLKKAPLKGGQWRSQAAQAAIIALPLASEFFSKSSSSQSISEQKEKVLDELLGNKNESFLRWGYWVTDKPSSESPQAK
jgi:hypothetical protein